MNSEPGREVEEVDRESGERASVGIVVNDKCVDRGGGSEEGSMELRGGCHRLVREPLVLGELADHGKNLIDIPGACPANAPGGHESGADDEIGRFM